MQDLGGWHSLQPLGTPTPPLDDGYQSTVVGDTRWQFRYDL